MLLSRYGGAIHLDNREPEGEKGVKMEIGWVGIDRDLHFLSVGEWRLCRGWVIREEARKMPPTAVALVVAVIIKKMRTCASELVVGSCRNSGLSVGIFWILVSVASTASFHFQCQPTDLPPE